MNKEKIEEILSKYPVPVYCWDSMIKKLSTLIQEERNEAVKGLREDILRMSVETADLSFRDGFFKARDIILHNIQEYLDKGE